MLYSFSAGAADYPHPNADGACPMAEMMQASDSYLYGTTMLGGTGGGGTIYRLSLAGDFTPLFSFRPGIPLDEVGLDGMNPEGGLIQVGSYLYGDAGFGVPTTFRFNPAMALSPFPNLMFQNTVSGQLAGWYVQNLTATAGKYIAPVQDPAFKAVAIADFNMDGQTDILFQNPSTGQLAIWFLQGMEATQGGWVTVQQSPDWRVVGTGDFNGDGKPDILFQNKNTGQLAVWYMDGLQALDGAYVSPIPDAGFKAVGVADFNHDARPDILLQNLQTGELRAWFLDGVTRLDTESFSALQAPGWEVAALVDLRNYDHPDIVFQNPSNGRLGAWYLNIYPSGYPPYTYTTVTGSGWMSPLHGLDWQVVGPH